MRNVSIFEALTVLFFSPTDEKHLKVSYGNDKSKDAVDELFISINRQIISKQENLNDNQEIEFSPSFNINNVRHKDALACARNEFNQLYINVKRLDKNMLLCALGFSLTLIIGCITLPMFFLPISTLFLGMTVYLLGKRRALDGEHGPYKKRLTNLCNMYIWVMNDKKAILRVNSKAGTIHSIDDEFREFHKYIQELIHEVFPLINKEEFRSFTRNDDEENKQEDTDTQLYKKLTKGQASQIFEKENTYLHYLLYGTKKYNERDIFWAIFTFVKAQFSTCFDKDDHEDEITLTPDIP